MGIKELVDQINGESQLGNFDLYDIDRAIGTGGAAKVYRVTRNGKAYAMKVPRTIDISDGETMPPEQDSSTVKDYMREASNWAELSDRVPDAVVCMKDYNVKPFPWMVMELADGDLEDAISAGRCSVADFIGMLRSLQSIHDVGVVHRDIKPRNILSVDGKWKFSDFGSSKIGMMGSDTVVLTGTPVYMAPEQVSKRFGTTDERTDIWQMGVILYRIIMGKDPYGCTDLGELSLTIINDGPLFEGVPPKYADILRKALWQDKDERYQTAAEFADALEAAEKAPEAEPPKTGAEAPPVVPVPPVKDVHTEQPPVKETAKTDAAKTETVKKEPEKDKGQDGIIRILIIAGVILALLAVGVFIATDGGEELDFDFDFDYIDEPTPAVGYQTEIPGGPAPAGVPEHISGEEYCGYSGELRCA